MKLFQNHYAFASTRFFSSQVLGKNSVNMEKNSC